MGFWDSAADLWRNLASERPKPLAITLSNELGELHIVVHHQRVLRVPPLARPRLATAYQLGCVHLTHSEEVIRGVGLDAECGYPTTAEMGTGFTEGYAEF